MNLAKKIGGCILFFAVFPDTRHFHLQHTYNAGDEKFSNFSVSHYINIELEDMFLQSFVENASVYKYGEEIFLNRFIHERVQEKLYKTHRRFYEYVKKTKSVRSMTNVRKQYLSGDKRINCKTYFCFNKGDHVRKSSIISRTLITYHFALFI